jgi:hypothetical protein
MRRPATVPCFNLPGSRFRDLCHNDRMKNNAFHVSVVRIAISPGWGGKFPQHKILYFSARGIRNSVVDVAWASSPYRSGTTPKSLKGPAALKARPISERASERAWDGRPRVPRRRPRLEAHATARARSARSVFPKTLCGELFHLEGIFKKSSTTPTGKIAQSREPLTMPPSRGSHPAPNRCPDSQLNPQFPRSGDGGFRAEMDDAMAFWVYWPESADQGKRESSP